LLIENAGENKLFVKEVLGEHFYPTIATEVLI